MARAVAQPQAIDDLRAIIRFTTEFDSDPAQWMGVGLFDLGESLAEVPRRGRPAKNAMEEITAPPPYILRHTVDDDDALILSIRHGAHNPK